MSGVTIYCPANCGRHVDFPHFIVRNEYRPPRANYVEVRTFILCRLCRHWINRKRVNCDCVAQCHDETTGYGKRVQYRRDS